MKKLKKFLLPAVIVCLLGFVLWLGWRWYDRNVDRSGWLERDGVVMYADFYGDPVTGWQTVGGDRYYFADDHSLHTGWLTTQEGTFLTDAQGRLQTHWQDTDRGRCYFGEDGKLRTGWQTVNGSRYYFDENGFLQTGWITLDGKKHYFLSDGSLAQGWQQTQEGNCYLDESGSPVTGWFTWEDCRFYLDPEGFSTVGWLELDGSRYFFADNGALCTGWLEQDGLRYYLNEAGTAVTGWLTLDDNRYYLSEDGTLCTGWLTEGEYRYYLLPDGKAATGAQEIDGVTHYFTPDGIRVLLANAKNPLPDDYDPTLVETERGFRVSVECAEALDTMMAAMRQEGLLPYFSSAYRSKSAQAGIWQNYVDRYLAAGYTKAQADAMTASYVAVPGTSEHQTGLAVDIVGYDYYYGGHYGSTKAVHAWLAEHCWEYGFILRYTEEKRAITGIAPEPWHFRYVGTAVSLPMRDSGLCLEEYLGAVN